MRTTVDLDPELLERLHLEATRRRVPFKEYLNGVIRRGLTESKKVELPYKQPTFNLGAVREGVNLDKALAVSEALDDVRVRETHRRA